MGCVYPENRFKNAKAPPCLPALIVLTYIVQVSDTYSNYLDWFLLLFIVVDIPGEDGASPLHYAARFRASSASKQVSQVDPDVAGDIEGVVAPLTNALNIASLGVDGNDIASQV